MKIYIYFNFGLRFTFSGLAKFARIGTLNLYDSDDLNVQDFTIVDRINHPKWVDIFFR